jgi:hypothetical protein
VYYVDNLQISTAAQKKTASDKLSPKGKNSSKAVFMFYSTISRIINADIAIIPLPDQKDAQIAIPRSSPPLTKTTVEIVANIKANSTDNSIAIFNPLLFLTEYAPIMQPAMSKTR